MAQLNILISSKGTSETKLAKGQPNGGVAANNNLIEESNSRLTIFQSVAMTNLVTSTVNLSKSMITDSLSMYGDMTGEYLKQTKIDNTFKVVGGISSIAGNITTATAAGGLAGFAVSTAVETGKLVYTGVKSNINYSNSIVKANIQAIFNSQRIGNVLIGGGRIWDCVKS